MEIIKGVTFFQKGISYVDNMLYRKILYSTHYDDLLREKDIFTKLTDRQSRWIAEKDFIFIGSNAVVEPFTTFVGGNHIHTMGSFSYSRSNLPINTIVGRYTSIAPGVRLMGANHSTSRFTTSYVTYERNSASISTYKEKYSSLFLDVPNTLKTGPIVIGNDVWIGSNVTFSSKGIVVHDGAVIAANSTVTKDVPPYAVVGGVPAKIIRFRFPPEVVQKLLEIKWWQYDFGQFSTISGDETIVDFIGKIETLRSSQCLVKYSPSYLSKEDFS
ncbi:CatB-related O-acetyltransferase [Enterococcus sp. AZ196]|uniref:CatB-related O-acetyltransferase n=1 Tax=Enterococcus sp. AZ196 TaxID=2774659 RepID=UPI003D2D3F3C